MYVLVSVQTIMAMQNNLSGMNDVNAFGTSELGLSGVFLCLQEANLLMLLHHRRLRSHRGLDAALAEAALVRDKVVTTVANGVELFFNDFARLADDDICLLSLLRALFSTNFDVLNLNL